MPSILFGFVFPNSFQKAVLGYVPLIPLMHFPATVSLVVNVVHAFFILTYSPLFGLFLVRVVWIP